MARNQAGCTICGAGVIQRGPRWMGEFRALYTFDQDWTAARLSGVGSRHSLLDLAPRDAAARYDEHGMDSPALVDDISLLKVSYAPPDPWIPHSLSPPIYRPNAWGFPFHAACWLLMAELFDHQINRQFFFDLLLSLPIANGVVDWGHNYGGLLLTNDQITPHLPGEERTLAGIDSNLVLRSGTGEPIYTFDPIAVKQLLEMNVDLPHASAQQGSFQYFSASSHPNILDPFAKLPTELVQLIFNTMQSQYVVSLKIASRVAAATALTESFWASRFRRGFEFEDIFEAHQQPSQRSYRKMYFKIKLLKDDPSIRNRRRISRLILSLRILMTQYSFGKCSGQAVPSFFEPYVSAGSSNEETWQTSARAVVYPEKFFSSGCRMLRYRQAQLPNTIPAVFVSFVEFNSTPYISGLRFESEAGDDVQLGYIQHKYELRISLGDDEAGIEQADCRMIAFRVAMDLRGLRAIAITTNRGPSLWCGAHEGIPKSEVTVKAGFVARIRAGFDAIKIVSLAMSSGDAQAAHDEPPATATEARTISLRERAFWLPDVSELHLKWII
ncbi:hypothetical protein K505DRAFT_366831 [Melanomma pulvis-pyrius CBS 109.77]|uniref:DUF7600 domain-containing protein n=1 Tax=Melanomma pulvis-pyrius CBS 109.77 TaxID=1314802 RepID=A0A6A6WVT6_9PLEO|nr:hypothetical protein K505DRAFT_366831 [Melanomma pulvis-pyrius CBS 109.77]